MPTGTAKAVRSLLVVDDDRAVVETYRRNLQRCGFTVLGANDVSSGLRMLRSHQPDVCIVDFQIGTECGLSFIEAVRACDATTRMVLITAYGSMEVAVAAMRAGADDVIAKPVGAREILRRLDALDAVVPSNDAETPSLDRAMWEHMQRVLADCNGNRSEAARRLRVDRGTLARWLDRPAPAL
jgi:two-component system response regulator RegA